MQHDWKQSEAFHRFLWHFFQVLKQNFIAYRSSKVSDYIFEIHQQWQSGLVGCIPIAAVAVHLKMKS